MGEGNSPPSKQMLKKPIQIRVKVFYIIKPLKSVICLKYFTSFNSSNILQNNKESHCL